MKWTSSNFDINLKITVDWFKNNLSLISNGYHKNYDTNIYEKVLINDLKYTSSPTISSKGLVNKFNILFKNVTTESKNSKRILDPK